MNPNLNVKLEPMIQFTGKNAAILNIFAEYKKISETLKADFKTNFKEK